MARGLLEAAGTIDLAQFGPSGADAGQVKLSEKSAFRFHTRPGVSFKITYVFEGAIVRGKVSERAVDTQKRVVIRLQGLDAPELHDRPPTPTLKNEKRTPAWRTAFNAAKDNFRQKFGKNAVRSLRGTRFRRLDSMPRPARGSSALSARTRTRDENSGDFLVLKADPLQRVFRQVPLVTGSSAIQSIYSNRLKQPRGSDDITHILTRRLTLAPSLN
jgi:hypothetical protein